MSLTVCKVNGLRPGEEARPRTSIGCIWRGSGSPTAFRRGVRRPRHAAGSRVMSDAILFVDDEANVLEGFKRQLRKEFTLDTAIGPEEGLQAIAERGPFAVVVSDRQMPGMDGVEFLSQVRERSPD